MFLCTECGNTTPKWAGKCPFCGAWSTLREHSVEITPEGVRSSRGLGGPIHQVVALKDVAAEDTRRLSTANSELDRLGAGTFLVRLSDGTRQRTARILLK